MGPMTDRPAGNPTPPDRVRRMFDRIAPGYDRMNTLMTLGLDRRWRRAAIAAARPKGCGSSTSPPAPVRSPASPPAPWGRRAR
jgi:hypothetical protein